MASTSCVQSGNCNLITENRVPAEVVDFGTYTIYKDLPPLCNPVSSNFSTSEDGLWNCTLCGNDVKYMLPWVVDENGFMYFQFQEHDYISADWKNPTVGWGDSLPCAIPMPYLCQVFFDDGCTGVWTPLSMCNLVPGEFEAWCGVDAEQRFNYQVAKIHLCRLGLVNCTVKFKFEFFNVAFGTPYVTYYSEAYDTSSLPAFPYAEDCDLNLTLPVNCSPVVKLEGIYDDMDCAGFYYGAPSSAVGLWSGAGLPAALYRNIIGVYGKFYQVGYTYEVTKSTFGVPTSNFQSKTFEIRGRLVPPFVAEDLARIYGAKEVLVNGEATAYFYKDSEFSKQIANSRMWRLRPQFSTKKCQLYFGCTP